MRNSREFPKWLNAPETKEKLKGKKVMMYCTGGIRCERATALLSQMERAEDELQTQGIYHVRGGIDRYLKTFPGGGYRKGRNYLFDLRGEQKPEEKPDEVVDQETTNACKDSYCCVCKAHYALYKGKHVCSNKECKVPVIVCDRCRKKAETELKGSLLCQLCERGHDLRALPLPDLVGQKRRLALAQGSDVNGAAKRAAKRDLEPARWVHVGKLPLTITADQVRAALAAGGSTVEWIADRDTGFFYGSAYVEFPTLEDAERAVERAREAPPRLGGRLSRVNFAPARAKDPARAGRVGERPPIPIAPGRA